MKDIALIVLLFMMCVTLVHIEELDHKLDTARLEIYHLQPHASWLDHIRKISPPRAASTMND